MPAFADLLVRKFVALDAFTVVKRDILTDVGVAALLAALSAALSVVVRTVPVTGRRTVSTVPVSRSRFDSCCVAPEGTPADPM
jgi:hypothetical protein